MSQAQQNQEVRTRQVFYIPGYDPMVPRRYRELYRSESRKQANISGYEIKLTGKAGLQNYAWSVDATIGSSNTRTDFEFLLWSDIVRDSMERSIPATYLMMLRTIWIYLQSGALFRLMKMRKGPIIAALYPVFILLLQFVIAATVIWLTVLVGHGFLPIWIPIAIGFAISWALMRWFRKKDGKIFAYYLLHDYAFSAQHWGANPPALETRMKVFRTRIYDAMKSDVDEVLIVGHSSGAHLAVSILADLLQENELSSAKPKLAFLSLGQVVPMVSFLPKADKLRRDLNYLSQSNRLTWVDVTAPGDGCTFALCDPVSVSGVAPDKGKIWPLVISAAFTQSLSEAFYKSIRWRFFRLHFQYLCSFDRPKDYDYFQITAGPISLKSRYHDRTPSKSRIETPLSGHTSQAVDG